GGADGRAVEQRSAGRDLGPVADHQHLGELHGSPGFCGELFDRYDVVLGDLVLLAAGPDHCKHNTADIIFRAARATAWPASGQADGPTPPRGAHYRSATRPVNHAPGTPGRL